MVKHRTLPMSPHLPQQNYMKNNLLKTEPILHPFADVYTQF